MNTWIILLRGVNVGGHNSLPMAEFRGLLTDLGCKSVKTYIQSGNAVAESKHEDAAKLEQQITEAIDKRFGFSVDVLALTQSELEAAANANPFSPDDPKTVHCFFLPAGKVDCDQQALQALKAGSETYALIGRTFYLHAPDGIGRSKLAAKAERHLGGRATARNLRTVNKLIDLAQSLG